MNDSRSQAQLMTETYGPKSFIYQWLEGIAYEEDYAVLVTNRA